MKVFENIKQNLKIVVKKKKKDKHPPNPSNVVLLDVYKLNDDNLICSNTAFFKSILNFDLQYTLDFLEESFNRVNIDINKSESNWVMTE